MEGLSLYAKLKIIFPPRERRYFVLLFFLILIGTVFEFLGVSLILPLVNLLLSPERLGEKAWYRLLARLLPFRDQNSMLLALVLLIILVYVIKNVYAIYMAVVQGVFLTRNRIHTSARLLERYMAKPYAYHLQHNSAEVMRSIHNDVANAYSLVSCLIRVLTDGMISLLLVLYLVLVDPLLTGSIVAGLALYSLVYYLLVRRPMKAAGEEARTVYTRMIKAIQQAVGGIKEVKLMGRERYFVDSYAANGEAFVRNKRRYTILSGVPKHLVEILCVSGVLGLVAIKIAARQDMTELVGSLSAFAVATIRLLPCANSINSNINSISYYMPGLDGVCAMIQDQQDREEAPASRVRPAPLLAPIRVEQLRFAYEEGQEPVLRDLNLQISPGSSVGIMGATGAGKTTLVDLILGLLEPQEGRILYENLDIHENIRQWQARIGYVPQNIYLTDDSIRANVALGLYSHQIDDESVWRALEAAQLADFVRSLPKGLDTVIGERGVRISGGQRQRIGIARALYYDPEILFLDEATAALDTATEAAVMESVRALSGKKTCIIIAHRRSTIQNCDAIYEVREGRLERQR